MPLERWIQVCIGMMGIQPSEFYNMSIAEITLAIDGFKEYNTGKQSSTMNKDELAELMQRYPDN